MKKKIKCVCRYCWQSCQKFKFSWDSCIKDNEVSDWDLEKVNESAQAMAIPSDQRVLHVIPQKYVIDGQEVSLDPLGMSV